MSHTGDATHCGPNPERPSFPAEGNNFRALLGPEADTLLREWRTMEALQHYRRFGFWPGERG